MRWVGHTAHMGENIKAHRVFVRKPEETRLFGRYSLDGMIILKLILKKNDRRAWIFLAQDRHKLRALMNTLMNRWAPKNAEAYWTR